MQQIIQLLSETFGRVDPTMQSFLVSLAATMSWDLFKQLVNILVADPHITKKIQNPGANLEQIKLDIMNRIPKRVGILA